MEPKPRTLRLFSPYMHGLDVAELQRLFGVEDDGLYGPVTAAAVKAWKRARGGPRPSGNLSPADQDRLRADLQLRATVLLERWAYRRLREEPPGSNRVPQLVALAKQLEVVEPFVGMGFPWCAFAVFLAALAEGGRTAALGLRGVSFNALYTPDVLAAAEKGRFGLQIVPEQEAWRGDLVLFDWDPTGRRPRRPRRAARRAARERPCSHPLTAIPGRWGSCSSGSGRAAPCARSPATRDRRSLERGGKAG